MNDHRIFRLFKIIHTCIQKKLSTQTVKADEKSRKRICRLNGLNLNNIQYYLYKIVRERLPGIDQVNKIQ